MTVSSFFFESLHVNGIGVNTPPLLYIENIPSIYLNYYLNFSDKREGMLISISLYFDLAYMIKKNENDNIYIVNKYITVLIEKKCT